MNSEKRYSIILEHSNKVLLENATTEEIEAFWDANDGYYFGVRLEDESGTNVRIIVTDVIPEEEELCVVSLHSDSGQCANS